MATTSVTHLGRAGHNFVQDLSGSGHNLAMTLTTATTRSVWTQEIAATTSMGP